MFIDTISYPSGTLAEPWKRFYNQYKRQELLHEKEKIEQFNRHFKFHCLEKISNGQEFDEESLFKFLSRLSIQIDDWYELEQIDSDRMDYNQMDKAVAHMTPLSLQKVDDEDTDSKIIKKRYICEGLIPLGGLSRSEIIELSKIFNGHINTLDKVIVSEMVSILLSKDISDAHTFKLEQMTIRIAREHLSKYCIRKTHYKYNWWNKLKDWYLLQNT